MSSETKEILEKLSVIEHRLTALESQIINSTRVEYIDVSSDLELAGRILQGIHEKEALSVTQVMTQFDLHWSMASRLLHYLFFKGKVVKTDLGGGRLIFSPVQEGQFK